MDLNQSKILLGKINSLYKSMSTDEKNIASIEKDLMRNYISQLYECFLDFDNDRTTSSTVTKSTKTIPAPVVEKAPEYVQPEYVKPVPPPPPPPPVVERAEPVRVEVQKPTPVVVTPPPPPPPPAPTPKPEPIVERVVQTKRTVVSSGDHEELFEQQEAKELSERLSLSPIKDLKKAQGLNDKILTVKELFNGDQAIYDNTIAQLNAFNNFDEAKHFLVNTIANRYDWASKGKKKAAKNFIKLVRRRYI